ncbi:hypothetical protein EVAR_98443_1 [Eumeta japonica]|uniref:Uncharacterized protein n=1 Tax=Eumeta variegata TaxID=151549 RepID=A0A4C1YRG4_EUMVA|nr:hypothetical protein EVAR_98443_1 [Eumeta japonica]
MYETANRWTEASGAGRRRRLRLQVDRPGGDRSGRTAAAPAGLCGTRRAHRGAVARETPLAGETDPE